MYPQRGPTLCFTHHVPQVGNRGRWAHTFSQNPPPVIAHNGTGSKRSSVSTDNKPPPPALEGQQRTAQRQASVRVLFVGLLIGVWQTCPVGLEGSVAEIVPIKLSKLFFHFLSDF